MPLTNTKINQLINILEDADRSDLEFLRDQIEELLELQEL